MVQLIKPKSLITPAHEGVIKEFHDKLSIRELANKIDINYSTVKRYLIDNKYPKRYAGRKEVPFEEQKVNICISVKRKYYSQARAAAEEAVKQFKK